MKKVNKIIFTLLIIMTIFSFIGLVNININGEKVNLTSITLIIGIVSFFFTRKTNETREEGLDFKTIFKLLKDKKTFFWFITPLISGLTCYIIAKLFLPEFIEHLKARTGFLAFDQIPILLIELLVAAFGEEIAWRAFFQKQLGKILPFVPTVIIQAVLFSICHFNFGNIIVVLYDLMFVFIDAILFGIIFKRTDNCCVSTISHFMGNLFSVILVMFI